MLQKAADKLFGGNLHEAGAPAFGFPIGKGNKAVFSADNAMIRDRHLEHILRQIADTLPGGACGLAVHIPVFLRNSLVLVDISLSKGVRNNFYTERLAQQQYWW